MAATADSPVARQSCVADVPMPPGRRADRSAGAGLALGALGLGACAFVIARALETWRVRPQSGSDVVSILGQRLSYPEANAAALIVLALGLLGLLVTLIAVACAVGEAAGSLRLRRHLRAEQPRPLPGGALLLESDVPQAFCAGLILPRVYVTTGALAALDPDALAAVLAHECHHAARRDPLRLATARVLARALFFVPALRVLARDHEQLAELSADESAIAASPSGRSALARAMLAFVESPSLADGVGIDAARVDQLLGDPPRWRFPALLCAAAVFVIGVLAAAGALAGNAAAGSATLALPFVSDQPCVLVLAMIPAAICLLAGSIALRDR